MKKHLIYFLLLSPFIGFSQSLPFKDCSDSSCDEKKLQELLKGTEAALYEYYGFRYNDSIYMEIQPSGDSAIFKNSHFWVNEEAIEYYSKILAAEIDFNRLNPEEHYTVVHVQKLDPKLGELTDVADAETAIPTLAGNFNKKGQKAAYDYFYENYPSLILSDLDFEDMLEVELIMKGGKLSAINFIDVPLDEHIGMKFAQKVKEIEKIHFDKNSFKGADDYKISFHRWAYYSKDKSIRDEYLHRHLDYYVENGLSQQLKQIYSGGTYRPGNTVDIDTSRGSMQLALYNYVEAKFAEGKIENRWWQAVPTQEQIDANNADEERVEDFASVGTVPVFDGCNPKNSNKQLQLCFQEGILNHVSENFHYPEEAQQKGIQGRLFINFVVEKDGRIDQIEVIRGAHYLLDLEGIRVFSELTDCTQPALLHDNPVRMKFTMPINAKLK